MPRSFLINDKPKASKADRHRADDLVAKESPRASPATMETLAPSPLPSPGPQATQVSVDSLPYSIAKLTGNQDAKPQEHPPVTSPNDTFLPMQMQTPTSIPHPHPMVARTSNPSSLHNGTSRTPAKLSLGGSLPPIAHQLTSSSTSSSNIVHPHPAFAFPSSFSRAPSVGSSRLPPSINYNIPRDKLSCSDSRDNVHHSSSAKPHHNRDNFTNLQLEAHHKMDTNPPQASQDTCQNDKQGPATFVPNFFQGSHAKLSSTMFYLDHKPPGRDSGLPSELLPPFTNAKPLGSPETSVNSPLNPLSPAHMAMFTSYINTAVPQGGRIPSLPTVFHPTPPRAHTPSSAPTCPTTPTLMDRRPEQPKLGALERSPSPIEAPRSSTPADGGMAPAAEGDLSVSVVSTELDRSSDSGLDSGHQSSDFDGEAEVEEEQIDVVGDGDEDHEEGLGDYHDHEDDQDEEEEEEKEDVHMNIKDDLHQVTQPISPPLPIVRPQPKRSSDMCLDPISPVSSNSSLSPGSAGSYGVDFIKLNDPRFWPSSLPSLNQHYLPGLNSLHRGLPLRRPEGFMVPRLSPEGRPSGDAPHHGFPDKQKLPPINSAMRPGIGMGKHPFLPFQPSMFSGMMRENELNKQLAPGLAPSLPPSSLHQSFPHSPSPGMTLPSPNETTPLPLPGHLHGQKPRSQAATLPWLLDLPGFGIGKDGSMDRPPVRKANEPPRYQCDACKKSYATFSGLSKHKQFHCESHIKKEFSCKYCDKRYTSLGALKMHIRTHTLPCKCQICGKAFSRPWLLQGHIRTHTGEKPFSCQHCNRAFADRSNLRAHLQTHSDIKKYSCKCCTKTFSRMSLLLKHEENSCPGARGSMIAV